MRIPFRDLRLRNSNLKPSNRYLFFKYTPATGALAVSPRVKGQYGDGYYHVRTSEPVFTGKRRTYQNYSDRAVAEWEPSLEPSQSRFGGGPYLHFPHSWLNYS